MYRQKYDQSIRAEQRQQRKIEYIKDAKGNYTKLLDLLYFSLDPKRKKEKGKKMKKNDGK